MIFVPITVLKLNSTKNNVHKRLMGAGGCAPKTCAAKPLEHKNQCSDMVSAPSICSLPSAEAKHITLEHRNGSVKHGSKSTD